MAAYRLSYWSRFKYLFRLNLVVDVVQDPEREVWEKRFEFPILWLSPNLVEDPLIVHDLGHGRHQLVRGQGLQPREPGHWEGVAVGKCKWFYMKNPWHIFIIFVLLNPETISQDHWLFWSHSFTPREGTWTNNMNCFLQYWVDTNVQIYIFF